MVPHWRTIGALDDTIFNLASGIGSHERDSSRPGVVSDRMPRAREQQHQTACPNVATVVDGSARSGGVPGLPSAPDTAVEAIVATPATQDGTAGTRKSAIMLEDPGLRESVTLLIASLFRKAEGTGLMPDGRDILRFYAARDGGELWDAMVVACWSIGFDFAADAPAHGVSRSGRSVTQAAADDEAAERRLAAGRLSEEEASNAVESADEASNAADSADMDLWDRDGVALIGYDAFDDATFGSATSGLTALATQESAWQRAATSVQVAVRRMSAARLCSRLRFRAEVSCRVYAVWHIQQCWRRAAARSRVSAMRNATAREERKRAAKERLQRREAEERERRASRTLTSPPKTAERRGRQRSRVAAAVTRLQASMRRRLAGAAVAEVRARKREEAVQLSKQRALEAVQQEAVAKAHWEAAMAATAQEAATVLQAVARGLLARACVAVMRRTRARALRRRAQREAKRAAEVRRQVALAAARRQEAVARATARTEAIMAAQRAEQAQLALQRDREVVAAQMEEAARQHVERGMQQLQATAQAHMQAEMVRTAAARAISCGVSAAVQTEGVCEQSRAVQATVQQSEAAVQSEVAPAGSSDQSAVGVQTQGVRRRSLSQQTETCASIEEAEAAFSAHAWVLSSFESVGDAQEWVSGAFAAEGKVASAESAEMSSQLVVVQTVGTDTDVDMIWEQGVPARGTGGRQRRLQRQRRQQLEEAQLAAQATLVQHFGPGWAAQAERNLEISRRRAELMEGKGRSTAGRSIALGID